MLKVLAFILLSILCTTLLILITGVGLFVLIFGETSIWIVRVVLAVLILKFLYDAIFD